MTSFGNDLVPSNVTNKIKTVYFLVHDEVKIPSFLFDFDSEYVKNDNPMN